MFGPAGKTGAGLIDCKAALAESNGDVEEAISFFVKRLLVAKRQAEMQGRYCAQAISDDGSRNFG